MSQQLSLLPDSSGEDDDLKFSTDNVYAKKYDIWRNKEELQKLKDLEKNLSDSSSESDEEIVPQCEPDFFRVMSLSMSRDPKIYDKNVEFFKDGNDIGQKAKVKKEKPMFMKDYERKFVLEHNGVLSDDEEHVPTEGPTYKDEQDEIREGFKEFMQDSDNEDDLLQVRTESEEVKVLKETDYKKWLETDPDMAHLNKVWNDPNLDEKEKFLRDYILNNGYENGENADHIPNYAEITDNVTLSEDEKIMNEQDTYEHKYNFRFEEPDQEFIKRYPRIIEDSLRTTGNKRKLKRHEYAERKKREKEQKREEIKRLKALKRKEIEQKFRKLKEITGQEDLNLDESDIEGDFDPEKHDQKMRNLFNDDYYAVEEIQKPEFSYEEEVDDENWDQWTREPCIDNTSNKNAYDDELQINNDVEETNQKPNFKQQFQEEMVSAAQSRKKGKKKSLFAKIISEPKPAYNPDGKSFEDYLDEYYKLDYEDIIGDLPVRFKYRKVIPNDFGLSIDEIFSAQDKELNTWCSVKKTCQYRKDGEERSDVHSFMLKARNLAKKHKILSSVYSQPEEEEVPKVDNPAGLDVKPKKKKNKKRKKGGNVQEADSTENAELFSKEDVQPNEIEKVSKKRKPHNFNNEAASERTTELDYQPFLQSPNNHKMPGLEESVEENGSVETSVNSPAKKKKHKKRKKGGDVQVADSIENAGLLSREECLPKKHGLGESVEENGSVETSVINPPAKKIKREEFSNLSGKAGLSFGSDREAKTPSTKPTELHTGTGISKSARKKKKKSKKGQESFHRHASNKTQLHNTEENKKKLALSNARLAAFGISAKRFKNNLIYKKK